ncbi:hypothetical protein V7S43_016155 [Phytophthora oleae]|uniref:Uncharacterized protein n=1 Tax=Phytophthora oleae TaxID=2107226 RepID=A0ABD3EWF6_9STRA
MTSGARQDPWADCWLTSGALVSHELKISKHLTQHAFCPSSRIELGLLLKFVKETLWRASGRGGVSGRCGLAYVGQPHHEDLHRSTWLTAAQLRRKSGGLLPATPVITLTQKFLSRLSSVFLAAKRDSPHHPHMISITQQRTRRWGLCEDL